MESVYSLVFILLAIIRILLSGDCNLYADLMQRHRRRISPQDAPPQISPKTRRELLKDDPQSSQFEMLGSYLAIDVLRLSENEGV